MNTMAAIVMQSHIILAVMAAHSAPPKTARPRKDRIANNNVPVIKPPKGSTRSKNQYDCHFRQPMKRGK